MVENVREKLIELLIELFQNQSFDVGIIEHVDLIDDVGIDSLTFISLVVEIEAKFEINIADEKLLISNFRTVDDIEKIIICELEGNYKEKEE